MPIGKHEPDGKEQPRNTPLFTTGAGYETGTQLLAQGAVAMMFVEH
jgi:hypothetical protein